MSTDIAALLNQARLPEHTVEVCLRGDLQAEFEQRDRALERAREASGDSLAGSDDLGVLAEEIEALREQMQAATTTFRLRGLPRRRWTQLLAEHPARKDNDRDQGAGFNTDTFFDALVREATVEPVLSAEQWEQLLDVITAAQFDALGNAALDLNLRGVSVPFSFAASRILQTSADESRRPNDSASLSSGSTAGNRGKSRRTSTTKRGG